MFECASIVVPFLVMVHGPGAGSATGDLAGARHAYELAAGLTVS
jgi:hypothetical protein